MSIEAFLISMVVVGALFYCWGYGDGSFDQFKSQTGIDVGWRDFISHIKNKLKT